VKFYKEYSLQHAKTRKQEEMVLRRLVWEAVTNLQGDPLNLDLQAQLKVLSSRLQVREERLAEGQRIRSLVKWKQFGDSSSKEFFKATCEHSGASTITELEDAIGETFTDQANLKSICQRYYSSLDAARPQLVAGSGIEDQAMTSIFDQLCELIKAQLQASIQL
jgi:hypothetical protein